MAKNRSTPTDKPARVSIRGLTRRFGTHTVLDQLDLDVAAGELVAVLGPSGSGKTTLLRLICGFDSEDAGSIRLDNRLVADHGRLRVPPEKRRVGYVAQEGALFPHLSVRKNIAFGLPRRQRHGNRISELLHMVGLPAAYARRTPAALSGGEQQRVALARALAPRPSLVLLDEPFAALDTGLRAETRAAAINSLKQAGASAILVTHDQNEALSMGDRVAMLHKGRFAQVAPPQTIYRHPQTAAVARFVGDSALVPGTACTDTVDCCFGQLPLHPRNAAVSGAVDILVRPEQIKLEAGTTGTHPTARVQRLDFYGHDARVRLCLPDGPDFTAVVSGDTLPTIGESVGFSIAGPVHAYPAAHS